MNVLKPLRSRSGASAAEFALVLPLMILLLFGVIDAGRFLWEFNRAEKATQVGARVAIVTDVIPGGFASLSYVGAVIGGVTLTQGDVIPVGALGTLVCTSAGCDCDDDPPCPAPGAFGTAAFNRVVDRMNNLKGDIAPANVVIEYTGSGLGYAGDPHNMDISPLVTVKLTGLKFDPLILFGTGDFTLPDFRTTLTAEDSAGIQSN